MTTAIKPEIFDHSFDLEGFLKDKPFVQYVDAFERQLKELFFIEDTKYIGTDKPTAYASEDFTKFTTAKTNDFNYIYYPWNQHIVKCITPTEYFRLKTNRNQDLITAVEQAKLKDYSVAVLGMSVGSNIAFVLTQAGISNRIALADFDELDTTNLNRILAGVHQVGTNKTIVAARRIYEDNPYADVITMPEGVTTENLEKLLAAREVNCIIEEIDDISLKIHIRRLALKYKVPVLMITDNGDGVVLHVERYDTGYNQIFDKDLSYWDERLSAPMSRQLAGDIIMNDIVGGPQYVDPKMIASVKRVFAKELVSWSQLGSAAILGGVVSTFMLKRIALGESTKQSIREYIKFNEW